MLPLILGAIAVAGLVAAAANKKNKTNASVPTTPEKSDSTYSTSVKKYGHLKQLKDYPQKIRWYEPKGEYKNRTFEKFVNGKWVKIPRVEFDYFEVSAANIDFGYKRKQKTESGGKRVYYLTKMSE